MNTLQYIHQLILPKKLNIDKQEDNFNYIENTMCDENICNNDYKISKNFFDNINMKKYTKLNFDDINNILNIYNNYIKKELLKLIEDEQLKKKLDNLDTGKINWRTFLKFTDKNYIEVFNQSLCEIKNNNKKLFSQIISDMLCKIKKCISFDDFNYIKKLIFDNINEIYKQCKFSTTKI